MTRLTRAAVTAALVVPATIALPTVSAPAAAPHPVPPVVQQIALLPAGPGSQAASAPAAPGAGLASATTGRVAVQTPERATRPFRLVGLTWAGDTPEGMQVQVRLRTAGAWGGWEALEVSDDGPDPGAEGSAVRQGVQPMLAPGSDGVQVRVTSATGAAPAGLRLELVDPGTSPADGAVQPTPASTAAAAASTPPIVTRAQWGADESLRNSAPRYSATVRVGFVHHSASSNSYWQRTGWSLADAARDIRAIYAYDTRGLGWSDIAYNFLVDMAGRIYEGRAGGVDKAVLSAATGGFNTDTMAVAALGNLQDASPSSALVDGIARILAWKLDLFHRDAMGSTTLTSAGGGTSRTSAGERVTITNVSGHRDVGMTACPGQYLYPQLSAIRQKVRTYQGVSLWAPSASATSARYPAAGVTVRAQVPGAQQWRLTVRAECSGATVVTRTGATTGAGTLAATWDGKAADGSAAPTGRYSLLLESWSATGTARPVTATFDVLDAATGWLACPDVRRLGGSDRYATSVAIGRSAAPSSRVAVLASGEPAHLVDGLVAAPLAHSLAAPLLLSTGSALPRVVVDDLTARRVTTVYLVGGPASLGAGVESAVRAMGATVVRLAGSDRHATAAAVARQMGPSSSAVVAGATGLADALVAGGPAGALDRPILLVTRTTVPETTAAALRDLGVTSTTVVGGTGVVADSVLPALPGARRVSGADRYATAAAVAAAFDDLVPAAAVVVGSGADASLVDALPGGALGRITLLTPSTALASAASAYVGSAPVTSAVVLGGPGAVSDATLVSLSRVVG